MTNEISMLKALRARGTVKKVIFTFAALVAIAFFVPLGIGAVGGNTERKIVVFDDQVPHETQIRTLGKFTRTLNRALTSTGTYSVSIDAKDAGRLAQERGVVRVEDDAEVQTQARYFRNSYYSESQTIPWGVLRVGAPSTWTLTRGQGVKVAVIDTGIDYFHADLASNYAGGASFVSYTSSARDDNGHGSHVAGTIAAVDNSAGVVGVAPSARLYAVKVLDRRGSGYISDVIEGIDWAIANGMQVINLSLGTTADIQSFHDAIVRAHDAGIVVVAAAGNSGPNSNTVLYPAKYPETIAVSATDTNDNIASFSSRGQEVDVSAPGVSIYSTYKSGKYATLSGTSMATPHVSAVAALVLTRPVDALYDANTNSRWDPDELQKKLQDTSVDLGSAGFDALYGWGRVDAKAAAQ